MLCAVLALGLHHYYHYHYHCCFFISRLFLSYANTVSSIKAHMPLAGSSWGWNLLLFVVVAFIGHTCSNMANAYLMHDVELDEDMDWEDIEENQEDAQYQLPFFISVICSLFLLLLVTTLRRNFRKNFAIPGDT